jgi:hypothetical protein
MLGTELEAAAHKHIQHFEYLQFISPWLAPLLSICLPIEPVCEVHSSAPVHTYHVSWNVREKAPAAHDCAETGREHTSQDVAVVQGA